MNRRILFTLAAVALAVIAVTSRANATCPSPQAFASASDAGLVPVVFGPGMSTDPSVVIGRFWDANNFNNINNGPGGSLCPASVWLSNWNAPDPALYIVGFMGATASATPCDNVGLCLANTSMMLTIETKSLDGLNASFTVGRVKNSFEIQDPVSSTDYDFARTPGQMVMVPVPRPRSTRTAPNTFTVAYDTTSPGIHLQDGFTAPDSLVSYKLVTANSPTDPGRSPSAWATLPALRTDANTGSTVTLPGVVVDCANQPTVPHWIAVQALFQGGSAGPQAGSYIGAATQINCDPTIADPKKPKPIGKKTIAQ